MQAVADRSGEIRSPSSPTLASPDPDANAFCSPRDHRLQKSSVSNPWSGQGGGSLNKREREKNSFIFLILLLHFSLTPSPTMLVVVMAAEAGQVPKTQIKENTF